MALEDLEKIHTKFLVFEDEGIVPVYIGIGNNQPYNISEKSKGYGKNRFYRYDLVRENGTPYQQMSKVVLGEAINFSDQGIIAPEITCDGRCFALDHKKGIVIRNGKEWRKAKLENPINDLDLNKEMKNNKGIDFLKDKLSNVFPEFDSYSQVFYDPLERIKSFGYEKTLNHLIENQLLGEGSEEEINVASDLYLNGYDPVLRIKPSLILMYHMIDTGKFSDLIINTSKGCETKPFDNK